MAEQLTWGRSEDGINVYIGPKHVGVIRRNALLHLIRDAVDILSTYEPDPLLSDLYDD